MTDRRRSADRIERPAAPASVGAAIPGRHVAVVRSGDIVEIVSPGEPIPPARRTGTVIPFPASPST